MRNLLFVDCCLRSGSRTRRLAGEYLNAAAGSDTRIQGIVLAQQTLAPLDEETLHQRDEDIAAGHLNGPAYAPAREFAAADEIVIAAPFWDASFPAKLKIYLENICVNGITFAYGEQGTMVKKCRADRLTYITTSGGFLGNDPSVKAYFEDLCKLFSIPEFRFFAAEGLDAFPERADALLEQAGKDMLSGLNA